MADRSLASRSSRYRRQRPRTAVRHRARPRNAGRRPSFILSEGFLRDLAHSICTRFTHRGGGEKAPYRMNGIQQQGIRQVHCESRQLLAGHIQRGQLSLAALLVVGAAQALLLVSFVRDALQQGYVLDRVGQLLPDITVICCLTPFTYFLARLHACNRGDISRFRKRVAALESDLEISGSHGIAEAKRL